MEGHPQHKVLANSGHKVHKVVAQQGEHAAQPRGLYTRLLPS